MTVAGWTADALAQALTGADALVSAVPAAAWTTEALGGLATLAPEAVVLEMAYGTETPLAASVRGRTRSYADGLAMLVHQAAHAITLALGKQPPLPPLFEAVRRG